VESNVGIDRALHELQVYRNMGERGRKASYSLQIMLIVSSAPCRLVNAHRHAPPAPTSCSFHAPISTSFPIIERIVTCFSLF